MAEVKAEVFKAKETDAPKAVVTVSPKESEKEEKQTIRYVVDEPKLKNKFIKAFFGDGIRDFKDGLIEEIIVPAIKDMVVGAVEDLFDTGRGPRRRRRGYDEDDEYVSYSSYYKSDRRERNRDDYDDRYSRDDYRNIGFYTKVEAMDALDRLKERLERSKKGYVTILDFYDILDKVSKNPQDAKWGWRDLSYVRPERRGNRYYIDFPKIRYMDD